jgi:hypothetical protein
MIPALARVGLETARPWHLMDNIVVPGSDSTRQPTELKDPTAQ